MLSCDCPVLSKMNGVPSCVSLLPPLPQIFPNLAEAGFLVDHPGYWKHVDEGTIFRSQSRLVSCIQIERSENRLEHIGRVL